MSEPKYLGVEIGGTKLQLGVSSGKSRQLSELVRVSVDVASGAAGIVRAIEEQGRELRKNHEIAAVGVGFGGPIDVASGRVTKSHQIEGWDGFPLVEHLSKVFELPVFCDNDCNAAALGESKLGAGVGRRRVFYVTVGTGIGGGFVVDGQLDGNDRPAISEIGHLRPGPACTDGGQTVESQASGWGIATRVRQALAASPDSADAQALMNACNHESQGLTTRQIAEHAAQGNSLAAEAISHAVRHLGWAIAQVVTLLAPDVVVVGGGVSLIGKHFFDQLRERTADYGFAPLANSYAITPAGLGEEVVVHGAIQLAAGSQMCEP